jgi:hypothetical protein
LSSLTFISSIMDCFSWCDWSDNALCRLDIAAMNLSLAKGLPGADDLDVPAMLTQLDGWSALVRDRTTRLLPSWPHGPDADLSAGQFRMLVLVTVVQRDLGVTYYLPFTHGEFDARDSRNLFIHGILCGHGGTCATMPVLYAAIARRLGYPIRLVMAKEHLFCRWDDPSGERFNVEATSRGFASYADDYYRTWPKLLTDHDLRLRPYLHCLSPRQELADFIASRGACLRDHLQLAEAKQAFSWAAKLSPEDAAFRDEQDVIGAMHPLLADFRGQVALSAIPSAFKPPTLREQGDWRYLWAARRQLNRIYRNRNRTDIEPPPPRPLEKTSITRPTRKGALCTTPN